MTTQPDAREWCSAPGIYNDCAEVGIEDIAFCVLPAGHRGLHSDGPRSWGNFGDLSHAEKLAALGVDDGSLARDDTP